MMTGIEQYHLERAGYFVRRGLLSYEERRDLPPNAGALAEHPLVTSVVRDAVGGAVTLESAELLAPQQSPWQRSAGPAIGLSAAQQAAELARVEGQLIVYAALTNDPTAVLLPGSQSTPLSEEDQALLLVGPDAELPGQVRVRLDSGDVLFAAAGLLRRADPEPEALHVAIELAFTSARHAG